MTSFACAGALAGLATLAVSTTDLSAQVRGGGPIRTGTSGVASPTVFASWVSRENRADDSATTLLVLWRGTPGWFSDGRGGVSVQGGGGGGRSAGRSDSYGFEYVSVAGVALSMEFDYDKRIVKILNQQISLTETNVVLVDFVDSASGPTIVGTRWIESPASGQPPPVDPIAAVVKRTPELFEYLRCDLSVSDPVMNAMMPTICGRMRP